MLQHNAAGGDPLVMLKHNLPSRLWEMVAASLQFTYVHTG